MTLPIVVPEIVLAASLLLLFAALGLRLGFLTVILAHVGFSRLLRGRRRAGAPGGLRPQRSKKRRMDLGARPVADLLAGDAAR